MPKLVLAAPLLALVLSSCASSPPAKVPVQVPPAKLPPPPAQVMVKRDANFHQRLCAIFSSLSATPIPECSPSPPVKP